MAGTQDPWPALKPLPDYPSRPGASGAHPCRSPPSGDPAEYSLSPSHHLLPVLFRCSDADGRYRLVGPPLGRIDHARRDRRLVAQPPPPTYRPDRDSRVSPPGCPGDGFGEHGSRTGLTCPIPETKLAAPVRPFPARLAGRPRYAVSSVPAGQPDPREALSRLRRPSRSPVAQTCPKRLVSACSPATPSPAARCLRPGRRPRRRTPRSTSPKRSRWSIATPRRLADE